MKVRDIMTRDPACCTPETTLQQVAQSMADHDCGEIPVVEQHRLVGVVTDRDIVCRAVTKGKDPQAAIVREIMSTPVVITELETDLEDCCRLMETARVRRILVVDEKGNCCGIVSQADIACRGSAGKAGEVVRDVSQPSTSPSRVPEYAAAPDVTI